MITVLSIPGIVLTFSRRKPCPPCQSAGARKLRCTTDKDTRCRSVGIGRRTGLKIRRTSLCVWVQVPPPAPHYLLYNQSLLTLRLELWTRNWSDAGVYLVMGAIPTSTLDDGRVKQKRRSSNGISHEAPQAYCRAQNATLPVTTSARPDGPPYEP